MRRWALVVGLVLALHANGCGAFFASIAIVGDSVSLGFNTPLATGECPSLLLGGGAEVLDGAWCAADSARLASLLARHNAFATLEGMQRASAQKVAARAGATLAEDGPDLADRVVAWSVDAPRPLLNIVFLGGNDLCGHAFAEVAGECGSPALDPNDFCRSSPDAYRTGLELTLHRLAGIDGSRTLVILPPPMEMLCAGRANPVAWPNSLLGATCQELWNSPLVRAAATQLRDGDSLCGAIAADSVLGADDACSDAKVKAAQEAWATYANRSRALVADMGRAEVADPWIGIDPLALFDPAGSCDCLHPSLAGQEEISRRVWEAAVRPLVQRCGAGLACPLAAQASSVDDTGEVDELLAWAPWVAVCGIVAFVVMVTSALCVACGRAGRFTLPVEEVLREVATDKTNLTTTPTRTSNMVE
jgi:hypothetical protein